MRIAYLLIWNEAPHGTGHNSIVNKLHDQISMWIALGYEVKLFVETNESGDLAKKCRQIDQFPVHVSAFRSIFDRLKKGYKLLDEIGEWGADIVYCRYAYFTPMLFSLVHRFPVVVEVNSDELAQLAHLAAGSGSKRRYWYCRLTQGLWLQHVSGFVFVTQELSERPQYTSLGKPSVVIGNGIDLARFPVLPAAANSAPNLVFIAATAYWHGIDKIIELTQEFPEWKFHLIGQLPDGVEAQLSKNTIAYGFLPRSEYQDIIKQTDVAIGTLALHRIELVEASPLKVREYLAHGIPVITGYKDTDFPRPVPFILTLPNTEENVVGHFDEIRDFVVRWQGNRVERENVAHLDTRTKERIRIDFMQEMAQRSGRYRDKQ